MSEKQRHEAFSKYLEDLRCTLCTSSARYLAADRKSRAALVPCDSLVLKLLEAVRMKITALLSRDTREQRHVVGIAMERVSGCCQYDKRVDVSSRRHEE